MQYQARQIMTCFSLLCIVGLAATVSTPVSGQDLSSARRDYASALQAIKLDQWKEYDRLRRGLEAYPLAVYLDYFQLTRQVTKVRPEEAQRFLQRSADTPLRNRFLAVYLQEAGKTQRWRDFLQVKPDEPSSVLLKCYFFRAQLSQGYKELAWEGARRLWVKGESQPQECNPLFDAWLAAGGRTDEVVWTRLLNSFAARQPALLQFVAKQSSAQLAPWSEKLLSVYQRPETLSSLSLPADNSYSADIASHALAYLAGSSPESALSYWID